MAELIRSGLDRRNMIYFGLWESYSPAFNPAMIAGAMSFGMGLYSISIGQPKAATIQMICGALLLVAAFIIH